jgi:hypothetical protein
MLRVRDDPAALSTLVADPGVQAGHDPTPVSAGETVNSTIVGDDTGPVAQDRDNPESFEYRPGNPQARVTILFWLLERPEAVVQVDIERPL